MDAIGLTALGVIFGKLLLSCVLGGLIGYEREARHKSAGLRTNILVCLGSCLVMMISVGFQEWINADAARIAAQVVSGIGFLGAGAIMKEGLSVTGLTTAACLWVVAGVGLAVGFGFYTGAIMTTALVFLVLRVFGSYDSWMVREDNFAVAIVAGLFAARHSYPYARKRLRSRCGSNAGNRAGDQLEASDRPGGDHGNGDKRRRRHQGGFALGTYFITVPILNGGDRQ